MTEASNRDILDAIDKLVDEQLAGYGRRSGYDYNVGQDTCPHPWCDEDWHGLKITARMRRMRRSGWVDPNYRHADDDSETLCPGSAFDGDFTPPASKPALATNEFPHSPTTSEEMLRAAVVLAGDLIASASGIPSLGQAWESIGEISRSAGCDARWWRCDDIRRLDIHLESRHGEFEDFGRPTTLAWLRRSEVLVCGGQPIHLVRDPHTSAYMHHTLCSDGRLQLDVRSIERPEVGDWYLRDEDAILDMAQVRLLARMPNSYTAELRGGPRNGRTIDISNYGDIERIEFAVSAQVRIGEPISPTAEINVTAYVRAGFNPITNAWVYRPERDAHTRSAPTEPLAA